MKGAILFQGIYLMPGSVAHKLHTEKKYQELQQHMKELEEKKRKLEGRSNG